MAHENVLTLHCALSDRFQKMHLTLALYAMQMTQLESIEYINSVTRRCYFTAHC